MCNFCIQHGDGKRWYLNARNYARDLESDLGHRGFIVDFVRDFEANRRNLEAGLATLRFVPRPMRPLLTRPVSKLLQKHHFGQPVPLEDCAAIFDLATNITRLPCVCRGAMHPGSNAESCCIVMTVTPNQAFLAEAFAAYRGGPESEGFETLSKAGALDYLRRAEKRGLCHTVWTFGTPFIAAICNCDLPSGCMAMRTQLEGGIRIMWKGENVIRHDPLLCTGCGRCTRRCPFSAIRSRGPGHGILADRRACWGCGICRSACPKGALELEPRRNTGDVADLW